MEEKCGCVAVGVDDGDLRRAGDRQRRRSGIAVAERLRSVGQRLGDREPLERSGDDCAAAGRPGRREDGAAVDRRAQRLGVSDLVAREIAGELRQELGHSGRPGVPDELERRNELVGLDPPRRAVDPPPSLVALEDARQDRVEEALLVGGVDPGTGKLDRRLNELGPRDAPEPAVRLLEPCHEPGYRHGALADVEDLRRRVAEVDHDLLHLAERLQGCGEEAIEHRRLSLEPREEEAAAGRAGQWPLGHSGRKRGYDAGIDRIAAVREHARTCLGGDPVSRCDRALHELRVKMLEKCR